MNEFSPGVIGDLDPLLSIVAARGADRHGLNVAIASAHPRLAATKSEAQRLQRARNVLIGMSQCALFDLDNDVLTPKGQALAALTDDATRAKEFAKILLNECGCAELLDVVRLLTAKGEPRSKENINRLLRQRGFTVTTNEGNPSKLRQWLEKSGLVAADWTIDETVFEELTGSTDPIRQAWFSLTRPQRALLVTLRDVNAGPVPLWHGGSAIKQLCIQRFGPEILPEGPLRAKVLNPLEAEGWIVSRNTGPGRGGKLGDLQPTTKLLSLPPSFNAAKVRGLSGEVLKHLGVPLPTLRTQLKNGTIHERGLALETFAVHLALFAGLEPIDVRLRNKKTSRNEVDVIAEGEHLLFSRWIFQCKNTPDQSLRLPDLAREVGMAALLRGHVVVMVTTGRIGSNLKAMADSYETGSALQIVLLDGKAVSRIMGGGMSVFQDELKAQAKAALTLKRTQVFDNLDEGDE